MGDAAVGVVFCGVMVRLEMERESCWMMGQIKAWVLVVKVVLGETRGFLKRAVLMPPSMRWPDCPDGGSEYWSV
jgi:hypothetical protein